MLSNRAIDKIGVIVSNYGRSLSFFKDTLRLDSIWESGNDKNAAFKVGFNLLVIQESPEEVSSGGVILYFTITDISQLREMLVDAGVACTQVRDFGDFKLVEFFDPDGNRFGLLEPSRDYTPTMEEYLGRKISL